jgi:hypothetical protein
LDGMPHAKLSFVSCMLLSNHDNLRTDCFPVYPMPIGLGS